jgi:uracil phosphoribosyltransferase
MAAMAMALRVVVPPHPLLSHWLTVLRDVQTPQPLYATGMAELGRWLTYEAMRDWLPRRRVEISSEASLTSGEVVDAAIPLLALIALRAGLGLWQGGQTVLPAAQVGHLHVTDGAISMMALPEPLPQDCGVVLFWGELADPDPLLTVLDTLAAAGVQGARLRLITAIAAAPALQAIGERHGELTLHCAAIDPDLDQNGVISPGIGTVEPRLFGFNQSR